MVELTTPKRKAYQSDVTDEE
ncbi:MAG: hypothetical protein JWL90_3218, partial [Chthoniobacteraceae bacterium]|nr:hypothetical protein [Chthoniobacteraceae bacterium]